MSTGNRVYTVEQRREILEAAKLRRTLTNKQLAYRLGGSVASVARVIYHNDLKTR